MAAQLIYIHSLEQDAGSDEAKGSKAKGGDKGKEERSAGGKKKLPPRKPKFPPWYPLPNGTFQVFGQKPVHIGEFDSTSLLLESVKLRNLPGGSNTLFATVRNVADLDVKHFETELADLPEQLTIIVSPKV